MEFILGYSQTLVQMTGVGPVISRLSAECINQLCYICINKTGNSKNRIRTYNKQIKNQQLYQLSNIRKHLKFAEPVFNMAEAVGFEPTRRLPTVLSDFKSDLFGQLEYASIWGD